MEDLKTLIPDWKIHLRAKNLADRTIESYVPIAETFVAWLESNGMSTDADVPGGTIEIYLTHLRVSKSERTKKNLSAAEIAKRYRSLQQFFRWIADVEEIIPVSPFVKLSAPAVPVQPVPILRENQLRSLIEKTSGKSYEQRRDEALLRFFADTGARCEEVTTLSVDDLDFELCVARVVGKGRRSRDVSFGPKTAEALRRYLRHRSKHRKAQGRSELWIGREGPLTHFGIRQMVYRRCEAAGLPKVHPHTFRHSFAHHWLLNGGQETDLMRLTGWRSRVMVDRYGASAADERARQAHQKAGLGDRY